MPMKYWKNFEIRKLWYVSYCYFDVGIYRVINTATKRTPLKPIFEIFKSEQNEQFK